MHIAIRKVSAAFVTTVLLFVTIFSLSVVSGSAASFSPRLTSPDSSNPYYYNSDYNVFQRYGYGLPNCTAYAYGRAYEILKSEPKLSWNGAGQWFGYNKEKGYYKYGSTPRVGAIACWCYSGGGHVAVVEKIDSSGNMTLSNSEWGGRTFYLTTAKTSDSNPGGNSWWTFQGYIYLIDSPDIVIEQPGTGIYRTNLSTGYLNFRSGAGTSYPAIDSIYSGVTLTVTQVTDGGGNTWGYTTYNGKNGWVALEYCTYVSALPQATTAAPTTAPHQTVAPVTLPPKIVPPATTAQTATAAPATTVPVTTAAPTTVPATTEAPTTAPAAVPAQTTVIPATEPTEPVEETTAQPVTEPAEDDGAMPVLPYKKGAGIGDIDGNDVIDIRDATCIQKYLAFFLSLNDEQISWCDFDFDGTVSIYDVTCMQRYLSMTI